MPEYYRGRKAMPAWLRAHFHAQSFKRNGNRVQDLPPATEPAYCCAQDPKWYLLPTDDQGQCGDCFGVSAVDAASCALVAAGVLPRSPDSQLSTQAGLDCGWYQGGCNGGDEAQVIDYLKTTGAPLAKDYGPYTARAGHCKTGLTLYKIADWGYCTPSQQGGVASTQDMKNCIKAYGVISIAIDAVEFNNYSGGTMTGGGTNVDHAIKQIGWDDNHDNGDGTKGAFIVWNQWGRDWGITIMGVSGCGWVKYGADSCGTEAIWLSGGSLPPPPPPPVFTPPFRLFEGTMGSLKPVGDPAGYADLPTAHSAAQNIANKDQIGVMIHDSAENMVEIVPPLPPTPPPVPPGPGPGPAPSATFTIPPGALQLTIFGIPIGTISGYTGTLNTATPEHGALPPWVIEMILADLRILCAQAPNLPSPWNTWAGIACGLIPPAEHHRMSFASMTPEAVPPWLLPLIRILCQFAAFIPPPIGPAIVFACGLLPASVKGCGGCK